MPDLPQADAAIAQLACGALRGEGGAAWSLLVAAWLVLERYVRIRLVSQGTPQRFLEDCGQNVFARVWHLRKSYRGRSEGQFWRWLRQICDNERRRLLGRELRRPTTRLVPDDWSADDPVLATGPYETPAAAMLGEELAALRDCLRGLDAERRRVVELIYFPPALPERAIAELLDCSPANVHRLKVAALGWLRACLDRKGVQA